MGDKVLFEITTVTQGRYKGKQKAIEVELLKPSMQITSKTSDGPSKPLVEWTEEEVQEWISNSKKFKKFASRFSFLTGEDLAGLSEANFLRRCPEMGDVMYNEVQKLQQKLGTSLNTPCLKLL